MSKPSTPHGQGRDCQNGSPALRFCDARDLTITRRRSGKGWSYHRAGERITCPAEIARLNAIALPPAYADGAFNPDPLGHLQAIGTDARGRRQYRYHPDFRASQEATKFSLCYGFGTALTPLRRVVARDLRASPDSRAAVLAAMVTLLDVAYLRVGNRSYWRDNRSVGLSTLQRRHVTVRGSSVMLDYVGKAGIRRSVRLADRSLCRVVARCQDLPGQQLFQYRTSDGTVNALSSDDVNTYLRTAMGEDFTAKHFRTWHASVLAFEALHGGANIADAIAAVARALGNTPAVARKSYIHPVVIAADPEQLRSLRLPRAARQLSRADRGFLSWLEAKGGT
jgi:DNA topoisomerase-1